MSFRSSPHPLSYEGKQVTHPITHRHHYNVSELHKTYKITDNPNSELLGGTFLNDRKLRSLDENKFGSINGSYLKSDIPQPDFVDKLSNNSFANKLFGYNVSNLEELKEKKEEINNKRKNMPYKLVPGLEKKPGLNLNRLDGLADDFDETDLYESYCHKKYAQYFPLKKKL